MDIKTVGERVKLLVAVKSLRQECYSAAATAARAKHAQADQKADYSLHNQSSFNVTTPHPEKTSKSAESKSLLNRSNSFSRFLGRSDSKKSLRSAANGQDPPPMPPSPRAIQKRQSLEKGIMSMERVKQTCVKVFGEEGQTRIVNVHSAADAKAIMAKVLHKFGIDEINADKYCIFVGSSTNGEARALSDTELTDICKSTDRPEKERLILRKRHQYPTHEEFKRKGTTTYKQSPAYSNMPSTASTAVNDYSAFPDKQMTLDIITGSPINDSAISSSSHSLNHLSVEDPRLSLRPQARVRRFFGERPPSAVISNNLPSFFPNHKREVLETAGINAKRLSMTRSSSTSRTESVTGFRNSVLPELVSVLGVDLGKFLEEEEEEDESDDDNDNEGDRHSHHDESITLTTATGDESVISYDSSVSDTNHAEPPQPPTTNNYQIQNRSSSLLHLSGKQEATPPENDTAKQPSLNIPEPITPTKPQPTISNESPVAWMKGSLIGRGTFGDVYLGLNPLSGELMAVKQVELPVENSATEERKKSMVVALQREIELLKDLQHENIVQYLGSQTDPAHFSIFLEYVPGGSVAGLLASYGAFQEPLVTSFVRQILKGLNYLHGKDIVHRDIKGANVLVDNKGGVKISDFGISKKVEEDIMQVSSAPHRPSLQGSIFWMAPEVVKQTHYTRKADIWSLGCMVVEMFTGDHPFPEFSQMQAIFKIGSYTAPTIPDNISEEACDFLRCTFKLQHEERPTANELLDHVFVTTRCSSPEEC
ncbi:kinase-like domain-containing protein [Fennellomyces sp. T-0311]|nr:kinase-like domain-containing protein [Fennellomyces sp. T-0311]